MKQSGLDRRFFEEASQEGQELTDCAHVTKGPNEAKRKKVRAGGLQQEEKTILEA